MKFIRLVAFALALSLFAIATMAPDCSPLTLPETMTWAGFVFALNVFTIFIAILGAVGLGFTTALRMAL